MPWCTWSAAPRRTRSGDGRGASWRTLKALCCRSAASPRTLQPRHALCSLAMPSLQPGCDHPPTSPPPPPAADPLSTRSWCSAARRCSWSTSPTSSTTSRASTTGCASSRPASTSWTMRLSPCSAATSSSPTSSRLAVRPPVSKTSSLSKDTAPSVHLVPPSAFTYPGAQPGHTGPCRGPRPPQS